MGLLGVGLGLLGLGVALGLGLGLRGVGVVLAPVQLVGRCRAQPNGPGIIYFITMSDAYGGQHHAPPFAKVGYTNKQLPATIK